MARFIELTQKNNKVLINIDMIEGLWENVEGEGTIILTPSCVDEDAQWIVNESYTEVKKRIRRVLSNG